jgi:EAL domain-containing protein (putative c-di-GMP-specific phosphodiesterase class I)
MADAIRTLLASGDLHTLFQPILDGATREAIGYEALTRGPHGHELNSPLALIAAAAQSGDEH